MLQSALKANCYLQSHIDRGTLGNMNAMTNHSLSRLVVYLAFCSGGISCQVSEEPLKDNQKRFSKRFFTSTVLCQLGISMGHACCLY